MAAAAVATFLVPGAVTLAEAQTQIQRWHPMGGELGVKLGAKLEEIVANYNKSQDPYQVVPTYKDSGSGGDFTDVCQSPPSAG